MPLHREAGRVVMSESTEGERGETTPGQMGPSPGRPPPSAGLDDTSAAAAQPSGRRPFSAIYIARLRSFQRSLEKPHRLRFRTPLPNYSSKLSKKPPTSRTNTSPLST